MGCKFVAHGATGKGNDQVRFELTFAALDPTLQSIVPWRDPAFYNKFQGRSDLLEYAALHGVPVVQTKAKPFSMDENMMHISYEAGILEDPSKSAPADMFRMTVDPAKAPDTPAVLTLTFHKGLPVRVVNPADGTDLSDPLKIFLYLNKIGGAHGVGRVDVVENRYVGIKSRGVYESPGAEILRQGHIGIEGACATAPWLFPSLFYPPSPPFAPTSLARAQASPWIARSSACATPCPPASPTLPTTASGTRPRWSSSSRPSRRARR
jgi:argininosuccinate synthase